MQFSSRKVWKEEAISLFYSGVGAWGLLLDVLALPCLSDDNTRPVPGFAGDRRERQAHLCMGTLAAPEPHFSRSWSSCVLGLQLVISHSGSSLSSDNQPFPMHGHPWGFLVHSSHVFNWGMALVSWEFDKSTAAVSASPVPEVQPVAFSPPLFAPPFSSSPSDLPLPSAPLGWRRKCCWNRNAGSLLQNSCPACLLDLLTSLFLGN